MYAMQLKTAAEFLEQQEAPELRVFIHEDKRPAKEHPRRYNTPTGDEVALPMPNEPNCVRDIVLSCNGF
jgi:hypothetical protein